MLGRLLLPPVAGHLRPLVGCFHQRQAAAHFSVKSEICTSHSGSRGNSGDLTDTDCAAGHILSLLLHKNAMNGRDLISPEKPECTILCAGDAVIQRIMLREGESECHYNTTLDLPLAIERIDGLADKVSSVDLLDCSIIIEHTDLCGIAVSHMADGIGNILRA